MPAWLIGILILGALVLTGIVADRVGGGLGVVVVLAVMAAIGGWATQGR